MSNIYISSCDKDGGVYRFTLENGKLVFKSKTDVDQPMYTVIYGGRLYVLLRKIDDVSGFGGVMSYLIDGDGELVSPSDIVSSEGICPCHLAVTDDEVYVVNYLSGNIIGTAGKKRTHTGSGPNLPRQDTAHTHFVNISPDGKYLLCCDLGLDSIFTLDFDLNAVSVAKVPDGHGARHLAYSPDGRYIYCANELESTVSVFAYDDGDLRLLNTYPLLDKSSPENTAAAIRVHDGYLYVSNRGENTVVCFKINGSSLEFISRNEISGDSPRDFDFCGDCIICTNEKTDNITVFKVDGGVFRKTDEIKNIKNPLCVTVAGE